MTLQEAAIIACRCQASGRNDDSDAVGLQRVVALLRQWQPSRNAGHRSEALAVASPQHHGLPNIDASLLAGQQRLEMRVLQTADYELQIGVPVPVLRGETRALSPPPPISRLAMP